MYQQEGMETKEVQQALTAFFAGKYLQCEKLAKNLLTFDNAVLRARGESLLASWYFSKGNYKKLVALPLVFQAPEEKEAIQSLLPFYTGHKTQMMKDDLVEKGEQILPNLLFFTVKINGKEGKFLFDTGAMATVINEEFYTFPKPQEEGIKPVKALNAFGEALKDNRVIKTDAVEFAGLLFHHKKCMLLPASYLTFPLDSRKTVTLDGVIGFDLIKEFAWRIDTRRNTIQKIPSVKHFGNPFLFCDFFPLLRGEINEKPCIFAFDTGANQTVLLSSENNMSEPDGAEKLFAAGGEGQSLNGWAENQVLTILGQKTLWDKIPIMKNAVPISYHFKAEGIFGMDALKNCIAEIDFPGNRLEIIRV